MKKIICSMCIFILTFIIPMQIFADEETEEITEKEAK